MSKKILLVDDEEVVVEIGQKRLSQQGYTVSTASNGEEALASLDDGLPDLIVLDIEMPKMNGYVFLTELEKRNDFPQLPPIIVVTAYAQMEAIFRRHQIRDYLMKPLRLQELIAKIKTVIG